MKPLISYLLSLISCNGYTIIELLIVVTIMAVVAVAGITNLGTFKEDKSLSNSTADIRTYFRAAQSNASSGVVCGSSTGSASWTVNLQSTTLITLECSANPMPAPTPYPRTLNFSATNVQITSIKGDGLDSCVGVLPVKVTYQPITTSMQFSDAALPSPQSCISNASKLVISLRNTKTSDTKSVTINKGGTIDIK